VGAEQRSEGAQQRDYVGDKMNDLRKAAQTALEAYEKSKRWPYGVRPDKEFDALRAALAQPEQDLQLVANFLKEYGLEVLDVIAALKTQPEQEPAAWLRQRDNTLAVNDGGLFGSDWTPLYYAALAQPEQGVMQKEALLLALEYLQLQKLYGPAIGFGNTTIDDAIAKCKHGIE